MTAQSTYSLIANNPNSNTVVSVFNNIPQTYTDLILIINGNMNNSSSFVLDTFNGISTNGSMTAIYGNASSSGSDRATTQTGFVPLTSGNHSLVANVNTIEIHILNYANSTTYKTVLWKCLSNNSGTGQVSCGAGTIQVTAPITSFHTSTQSVSNYWTTGYHNLYGVGAA